jgi:nitrate/TMAO reductase-like tetraheme cytochrome c subunit
LRRRRQLNLPARSGAFPVTRADEVFGLIKLYTAYNNRECLHCHAGMRKYEEASSHHKNPEMLAQAAANQLSCISSGCHDTVHDVANLKDATFWTPKGNGK